MPGIHNAPYSDLQDCLTCENCPLRQHMLRHPFLLQPSARFVTQIKSNMADSATDELTNRLMGVNIGGIGRDSNQATDPAASASMEKKSRERQEEVEDLSTKRQREFSATVASYLELAEKYQEWSSTVHYPSLQ
jgi:hypothetical protein